MIYFKRKGAFSSRKMFILDDNTILTISVIDKKSQKRYKKFKIKYYK